MAKAWIYAHNEQWGVGGGLRAEIWDLLSEPHRALYTLVVSCANLCVWLCLRMREMIIWLGTVGRPLHWLCLGFSISSACFPNSGARWELIIWLGNQGQAPLSLSSMTWPHQLTALPPPLQQCRTYMCSAQESTCRQAGKEQDHTVYLRICICVFVCGQTRCMYGRLWKSTTALWVKN